MLAPKKMRPPLVVVVGDVAASDASAWFTGRPLFGSTVLVTRPAGQEGAMAARLADLGARVLVQPAIEISPPDDLAELDAAIDDLGSFDWVVFSSRNGVDALLGRMKTLGRDARAFGPARIAAIGPVTADALEGWRLCTDLTPGRYDADALSEELRSPASGKRVLLIRASRGREVLAETLREAGAHVEQVVAYQSRDVDQADEAILSEIAAGGVDWITVTSSAIARSSAKLFAEAIASSPQPPRWAAISPLTAGALKEAGFAAEAVADVATADGVVDAVLGECHSQRVTER